MIRIHQGVDIVEIRRIKDIIVRNGEFETDIFTEREREYCRSRKNPYLHFAGRFAAKEACLKALGTGISGSGIDHAFREIEIVPDASGKPHLSMSGWTAKMSGRKKIGHLSVSISHSADYAVATVILTGEGGE